MHICVICHAPAGAANAARCRLCEGWFHLPRSRTGGKRCGRRALNLAHEGFTGAIAICQTCDAQIAEHAATGQSWTV